MSDAEAALDQALQLAEAAARVQVDNACMELQQGENKFAQLQAEAQRLESEFAPRYQALEQHAESARAKAEQLLREPLPRGKKSSTNHAPRKNGRARAG